LHRANYVTHRNGRLGARRPRGINVSEGKDLLLFAEGNHSLSYFDIHGTERNIGILLVTNSTTKFDTIFPPNKIYVSDFQYDVQFIKL